MYVGKNLAIASYNNPNELLNPRPEILYACKQEMPGSLADKMFLC